MLMAVSTGTQVGIAAVLFYLIAYLLMNLGAFAVVALIRNRTGSEELAASAGLVRRAPVLVVTLTVFLMSLLGLPPLAGFAAKFQIFLGLYEAGGASPQGWFFYTLLGVGVFNTVLSAFYYLRVIRVMALDEPPEGAGDEKPGPLSAEVLMIGLALGVLAVGLMWGVLAASAEKAAASVVGA
jgi:NADH-quinone oxidoreductase subunit N